MNRQAILDVLNSLKVVELIAGKTHISWSPTTRKTEQN